MIVATIRIEVENIVVDDDYYSFNYNAILNGQLIESGEHSEEHGWDDEKDTFFKMLKDGIAVQDVLQNLEIVL